MKTMKRLLCIILAVLMFASLGAAAYADGDAQARAVIGANLDENQIASVYQLFNVKRGDVKEMTVTNAEEREYLEGYVDESLIGTRSISCVYVELLAEGAGMDVTTSNITWCTPEMYISALATAGITDAKIVVAAPFEVSGTAALTGVYKAYEDLTGKKLDDLAKAVSTQELTITGELANEIGEMDSTSIVNDLKMMLDETAQMTDEEIRELISVDADGAIDRTMREMRRRSAHMAMAVGDGGPVGIVTLEDLIEEHIGVVRDWTHETNEAMVSRPIKSTAQGTAAKAVQVKTAAVRAAAKAGHTKPPTQPQSKSQPQPRPGGGPRNA